MAESYVLQFDIVTVMNIAYVDADLVVLLGLDAFGEGHRLSLHLTERVELADGLYSLVGGQNRGERTVGIVLELLNGHTAAEATATRQFARVIEEIGVSFVVDNAAMVGERFCLRKRHNLAGVSPGADW